MNLKHRAQAWMDLFGRYSRAFSFWWSRRGEMMAPDLRAHEAEFLPAALAVQRKPVSPVGRWVARMLILLLTALLLWSIFGHVDIVVDARGKIIPDGRTKTITATQVAPVRRILVADGQDVRAGQPLIELDVRGLNEERAKDLADCQMAVLQAARSRAMIAAMSDGRPPRLPPVPGAEAGLWEAAAAQLQGQWADFLAKRQKLDADIRRFEEAVPLAQRISAAYAALAKSDDVARTDALAKEQTLVDLQGQLDSARAQRGALVTETRKAAQNDLAQETKAAADARADAAKINVAIDQMTLRSPVDGTVQQLQVHTVGAAVPAAQPLLRIVPRGPAVEMDATLADKDVGFVHAGQTAEVKIDAFDYTKYGTIPAIVSVVSRDAIEDQKKGLQYFVRITLLRRTLNVDGVQRTFEPGMSGTVAVRTGRRRIIDYFLSPLVRHISGSLHER